MFDWPLDPCIIMGCQNLGGGVNIMGYLSSLRGKEIRCPSCRVTVELLIIMGYFFDRSGYYGLWSLNECVKAEGGGVRI